MLFMLSVAGAAEYQICETAFLDSDSIISQEQQEAPVFYWNNLPAELQAIVVAEMPVIDLITFKKASKQTYQFAKMELEKRLIPSGCLSFYDNIPCNITGVSEAWIHLSNQKGFSKSYFFPYILQRGALPQRFPSDFKEKFLYDVFPLEITITYISNLREGYNGENIFWKKNEYKHIGIITLENLSNIEGHDLKTICFTRQQVIYEYS